VIHERLARLASETAELTALFQGSGFKLYLVGGIVRDAVLNRINDHSDFDFTTDALPDQVESLVGAWADDVWLQGKRFGTIALRKHGRLFEITTHRAEAYSPDSRKPEVTFSREIETDLSRRDFTVNAMAFALPDMQLIDPFDGVSDLVAKRLRTPLDPQISFADDPLRMMRAVRFVAALDLEPDPELIAAIQAMSDRLSVVSAERVRDELDKLIVSPRPDLGLKMLVSTGLADHFLPELPALAVEQDPVHRHKDVLAHTIAVVQKASPDRILRLAALFHDIGKPKTRSFTPNGVTFHHHEVVGARMTRDRMRKLKYSNEDIDDVTKLVELHLRFHTYAMGWTDSAIRRYVRDAGPLLGRLNELTRCDCTTRNKARAAELSRRMDEFELKVEELSQREELAAIRPDLNGDQVMTHLGLAPGRDVGRALEFLLQLRLDEGPKGEAAAYAALDQWWAGQTGSGDRS
jgi:poly(A) polymerase